MKKLKPTCIGKTIEFPENNEYFYGQDMCTKRSIPSGIDFEIVEKLQTGKYMLIGNGYGKSNYGKDAYGNGAIFVSEKIIEEVIKMTESKPIYVTDYAYSGNAFEPKQKHSISPEKPTDLPPGSTPPPLNLTINGEPLSTKQLHEIITSQNIRNDTSLTQIDELMNTLKHIRKLLKVGHYDKVMKILDKIC